jgi:hypothetical protein
MINLDNSMFAPPGDETDDGDPVNMMNEELEMENEELRGSLRTLEDAVAGFAQIAGEGSNPTLSMVAGIQSRYVEMEGDLKLARKELARMDNALSNAVTQLADERARVRELENAMVPLLSFAIEGPSNDTAASARDAAVRWAKQLLGLANPQPVEKERKTCQ